MTRHFRSPESRYLQGFSLIELMISLALGLIILVAVLSAYTGAASAAKMAEAQGRMYEDGQAALTILTQQLRMAGNNPDQTNRLDTSVKDPIYTKPIASGLTYGGDILPVFVDSSITPAFELSDYNIRGCDGAFSNINAATSLDGLVCAVPDPVIAVPDSIALSYEADDFNTVPTTATPPLPTDCLGYALDKIKAVIPGIPAGYGSDVFSAELKDVFYFVADNRFYIDSSSATAAPSLYCQGNGIDSTAQPLVENIEDMQITYGVEIPDGQTRTVAGYLRADELLATPDPDVLAAFTSQERWRKVVTVRICLLVRSENAVVSDLASARYFNCAGTLETAPPDDLRLRRTYSTTVMLRNWLEIAGPT
ncbi:MULTISPECIES: PilW family protein [unclassified Marinobacter]|uniref:PilW family protein n=1 Tax=unclassified Marinobacter TaxID=83889 RepID=UPI00200DD23F|nr:MULTISPECIES: PilW family protein [unclassified Marinobacter]UQG54948.1 PilW family protein [Marinobacter sp. M4C]UQG63749.1 PilW family protein [Marinobacter sp. M2C]UQG68032.1 PilW family protein [Marinobacter sp. M1C]